MSEQPSGVPDAIASMFPGSELVGMVFDSGKRKRRAQKDHSKSSDLAAMVAVDRAKACSHPIRLTGSVEVSDGNTGDVVHQFSTDDLSAGVAYVPCKTRRASRCPSCASVYQNDAYHLIADGLRPGQFFDKSILERPAFFVTYTAPSLGPVHSAKTDRNGNPLPCRPRRDGEECSHGEELSCFKRHTDGDPLVGQAIAPCCFNYDAAASWNHTAGLLWRHTRIKLERLIAKAEGVSVKALREDIARVAYIKVAEFQARGLVHFHVAIRLDGPNGELSTVTAETLREAIIEAHRTTDVRGPRGERFGWGQQLDVKVIGEHIAREKLAGYFAKYATKSSTADGALDCRIRDEKQINWLPVNDHQARLIRSAWKIGNQVEGITMARWAHQFGFGGHFMTKSREVTTKAGNHWSGWSTTFKVLRQRRKDHNAAIQQASWSAMSETGRAVIEARWEYAGSGYKTAREAHLAALARQQRETPTTEEAAA
jgi:hypothetical protein